MYVLIQLSTLRAIPSGAVMVMRPASTMSLYPVSPASTMMRRKKRASSSHPVTSTDVIMSPERRYMGEIQF